MLIKVATNDDQNQWDDYVSSQPSASPYHRFAWKQAIEDSYSHKSYYLIAEDEERKTIGVLPSILIKPPFSSAQLCSLPFCDRGESLADTPEIEQTLLNRAIDFANEKGAKYEFRASQKIENIEHNSIESGLKVRMLLQLPDSSEILLASFKSKLRSQIRKAEKNGLEFEIGQDSKLIDEFYQVFTLNMKDLGSPTHSKKWFDAIFKHFRNNMIISIVRYNNIPVGAGIVLFNGEAAAIPWASTKREFNKLAPNMLLYWSLLKYSTDNGYKIFDFGRSSFGEGTYKFKQQWGAKPVLLNWKTYVNNNVLLQENMTHSKSNLRSRIETIWSHLPLPMTVIVGSRIRKYISL